MFNELGDYVQFNGEIIRFNVLINWSRKFLHKDDRIVWYLSVIRRLAYSILQESPEELSSKLTKKISRKLKGWTKARVQSDYICFSRVQWEHFIGFQTAFNSKKMHDFSFWKKEKGKSIPLSACDIIENFKKMEVEKRLSFKNQKFCKEGILFLETVNGWGWYLIEKGFSIEEARAMNHCGNGSGRKGDKLLSLREPVATPLGTFFKPHLTFILNRGYLYEMKGFANQKVDKRFHSHIEELLLSDQVKGLRGGGYLPENNFNFFDFEESSRIKVVTRKPNFSYDFFGHGGVKIKEVPGVGSWFFYGRSDCSDEAMSRCGLNFNTPEPNWLVLQAKIKSGAVEYKRSLAWCSFENGKVGKPYIEKDIDCSRAFSILLEYPEILSIDESLLHRDSTWGKFFDYSQIEKTLTERPGFFRKTSLDSIFNMVSSSPGFLCAINDQLGLNTKFCGDDIKLISFSNLNSFARRTGINSIIRKVKEFDTKLDFLKRDIFKLGWLTLCLENNSIKPLSLHIQKSAIMHFLHTLQIFDKTTPKELIQEIIFHYGPPDLFDRQMLNV